SRIGTGWWSMSWSTHPGSADPFVTRRALVHDPFHPIEHRFSPLSRLADYFLAFAVSWRRSRRMDQPTAAHLNPFAQRHSYAPCPPSPPPPTPTLAFPTPPTARKPRRPPVPSAASSAAAATNSASRGGPHSGGGGAPGHPAARCVAASMIRCSVASARLNSAV